MGDAFAASPSANMLLLLNAWKLGVQGSFLDCLTGVTTLNRYSIACLSSLNPASIDSYVSAVGTVANSPLPLEMAAIVKKTGNLKGQHGRGRTFFPSVPTSFTTPAVNPNLLNAAGLAAYKQFGDRVTQGFTIGGVSYIHVVTPRPIPPAVVVTLAAPILVYNATPLLGTQRRRREGRGI